MRKLTQFIANHDTQLRKSIRLYVLRSGLASGEQVEAITAEILSDTTSEALRHIDRFDEARHPMSWLLGIAANLIKRCIADKNKRAKREPLITDLYRTPELTEEELFDRLAAHATTESTLESEEIITELLRDLSPADQQVIRLAVIHELDGDALAKELGVKPSTARMRLHRALKRLRAIHQEDIWTTN